MNRFKGVYFYILLTLFCNFIVSENKLFSQGCTGVSQTLLECNPQLVRPNCEVVNEPYITNSFCEDNLGIQRYLSRAANCDRLFALNIDGDCWGSVDPTNRLNCDPPYNRCWGHYCPTAYCDQIRNLRDLNIQFILRASTAWFFEASFFPTGQNWNAAQQLVCDINAVYDCAGLQRPIIQAGIFESVQPEVQNIRIPIEIMELFIEYMGLSINDLPSRYKNPDNTLRNNINFNRDLMFVNGEYSITSIETQLWFFYQGLSFIDMGYKALHMGIFESYSRQDPSYLILDRILNSFREYAQDMGSFVIINGEGGNAKVNGTNELLFDFNSVPAWFREINTPAVNDGCPESQTDNSIFNAGSPCFGQRLPAILDPCIISNAHDNIIESGIHPSTGCYTDNVPLLVYFDFGHGLIVEEETCRIDPRWFEIPSHGSGQFAPPSNRYWGNSTYGYDDVRYFSEILTPECRRHMMTEYMCKMREWFGNGFLALPSQLLIAFPELSCNQNLGINPTAGGFYMLSDDPILTQNLNNLLAPTIPTISAVEECKYIKKCVDFCGLTKAPVGFCWDVGINQVTVKVDNPSCGSIYSIHIKDPNGNWLEHKFGTEHKFDVLIDGEYTISIRQDNQSWDNINDPNLWGAVETEFKKFFRKECCELVCKDFASNLNYDSRNCQLSWDSPPTGYVSKLQYLNNGQWVEASSIWGFNVSSPFKVTQIGRYRLISRRNACPDVISNEVFANCNGICSCLTPQLNYNDANCTLNWTLSGCNNYKVSLHKLNASNDWEPIAQTAISPFNISINGSYRLVLQQNLNNISNCPDILSNIVQTYCTPSSNNCDCSLPSLMYNENNCTMSWANNTCIGFNTSLQRYVEGNWLNINVSSPYLIPNNNNGQYRLSKTKQGCQDFISNIVNVNCSCNSPSAIVLYNGEYGLGQNMNLQKSQMYVHSVSTSYPTVCEDQYLELYFDASVINSTWNISGDNVGILPGYINNGSFVIPIVLPSPPSSGYGDVWLQSPCGDYYSLRLIYDCSALCPIITVQNYDYNTDCGTLEIYSDIYRTMSITYDYLGSSPDGWSTVVVFSETITYNLTPGINTINYCANNQNIFWIITYSGNCANCANCSLNDYLAIWLKPADKNKNQKNANLEKEDLMSRKRQNLNTSTFKFYPNPFSSGINMEFTSSKTDLIKMEVYNQLGVQVFNKTIDLKTGINQMYINEFENMPSGVYIVKMSGSQPEINTRVIKID